MGAGLPTRRFDSDLSWSSKLACCLTRQCKRICTKAERDESTMSLSSNNVPFSVEKYGLAFEEGNPLAQARIEVKVTPKGITLERQLLVNAKIELSQA